MAANVAYVVDSHVLGAYLLDALPERSDQIFEEVEHEKATLIILV